MQSFIAEFSEYSVLGFSDIDCTLIRKLETGKNVNFLILGEIFCANASTTIRECKKVISIGI